MWKQRHLLLLSFVFLQVALTAVHAQQSLLSITAPSNNTVATAGQAITISVSADVSVQVAGVLTDGVLPSPQATPSPTQFTPFIPKA